MSQISQTVTTGSGNFTLQFNAALRSYKDAVLANQQLALYVDGNLIQVYQPTSTVNWDTFTANLTLSAGNHVLSFQGIVGGDTSAFIDHVTLA
jgi:hypothetical protein